MFQRGDGISGGSPSATEDRIHHERESVDNFAGSYVSQLAIIDRHQAVTITLVSEKI